MKETVESTDTQNQINNDKTDENNNNKTNEIKSDNNNETKTEKEVEPEEIDINMFGNIVAEEIPFDSQPYSIKIKIPPMAAMVLKVNNINKGK